MTRLFISCAKNLETLLREELIELGIPDTQEGFSGVWAPISNENIYRINYGSRIATRVLLPLKEFRCRDKKDLYSLARQVDWSSFLNPKMTFAIDAHVIEHPNLKNSLFALQVLKDAICDQLREKFQERPSIDTYHPHVQIHLYIYREKATISFDTSGAPLYKRGWRKGSSAAPLQETMAAALLRSVAFHSEQVLCDPFCGSGTLLIEAAMIASKTPAGFYRKSFGFFYLPEFSEENWQTIKEEMNLKRQKLSPGRFLGADVDPKVLDVAYANLVSAGFEGDIHLIHRDIRQLRHPISPTLIVTNPPYGKRLEISSEIINALKTFSATRCQQGSQVFALSPSESKLFYKDFAPKEKLHCFNGGIPVTLYAF